MSLERLQQTALELRQPSQQAAQEFSRLRRALAEEHNQRMASRSDLEKLIGAGNLAMMEDNHRNFTQFMDTLFQAYEAPVLIQTVLWVFRAYQAHGFASTYWAAHLDMFLELLRSQLSPESFQEVEPFFRWMIVNIPLFVRLSQENLT